MVEIHLAKKGNYQHVIEKLMDFPKGNVRGIYSALGGEGHIALECFHNSIKELSILIDSINKIKGVRRTKSHIIAEFTYKDIVIPTEHNSH